MTIVVDRVLVNWSIHPVFIKRNMMIQPLFNPPLNRVDVLIRTQTIKLICWCFNSTDVDTLGIGKWCAESHFRTYIWFTSLFLWRLWWNSCSLYFSFTSSSTSQVSLNSSSFKNLCIFKSVVVGKSVDRDIIVKVIEILNNTISPGGFDLSASSFAEKGSPGTPHILFKGTGGPGIFKVHHKQT